MQTYCKIILLLWIPCTYSFEFCVSKKKPRVIEMAAKRVVSVKTLKKWQEEFKIKFNYDLCDRIKCQLCSRRELRIKTCKNFSEVWVSPGSESIMKDSVKKHAESLQHCEAYKLQQKSDIGADVYMESIVLNSPLGKSFLRLGEEEKMTKMACVLSSGLFTIT